VKEIAQTLSLSGEESRVVRRAVGGASALRHALPGSGSERLRFWQQWEPGAVEAVLLAIASLRATPESEGPTGMTAPLSTASPRPGQPTTPLEDLLRDALERRLRPQPPLLTGDAVMELLGMPPGPEVGRCLQEIEERRADGGLRTEDEAREWLRRRVRPAGGTVP
jgi:hypothetical protein